MTRVRQSTTFCELLGTWLPQQRWFAAKGGDAPVLQSSGRLRLRRQPAPHPAASSQPPIPAQPGTPSPFGPPPSPPHGTPSSQLTAPGTAGSEADVGITIHFVTATVGQMRATYQVPLTYHRTAVPELAHALVGVLDPRQDEPPASDAGAPAEACQPPDGFDGPPDGFDGPRWVYDGPHDPAFVQAWLALVATGAQIRSDDGAAGGRAVGMTQPGTAAPFPSRPARVLSGEQSNTSVVVGGSEDPEPVILKVFRVLQSGANPDVAVTSTLTSAGCPNVPRLIGWVDGEWLDPDGGRAYGNLTSVSEFLPGGFDAWRLACVAVENGQPFTEQARGIGAATAVVHGALARALPTSTADHATLGELADHLQQRLDWALAAVPQLTPYAEAARATVDAVRGLDRLPRLQRIHGDLHLGQVLDAGTRGWVLLDFEGEPLRPLADRNRQDLVLRDIAGMLRSFDYAARHTIIGIDGSDPRVARADAWAAEASRAFLDAYTGAGAPDPREDAVLLRALELDKALYEAVYETRNRPTWVQIPVSAITRLLTPSP
jgi:1,4-alpha-glucan branching enzyme